MPSNPRPAIPIASARSFAGGGRSIAISRSSPRRPPDQGWQLARDESRTSKVWGGVRVGGLRLIPRLRSSAGPAIGRRKSTRRSDPPPARRDPGRSQGRGEQARERCPRGRIRPARPQLSTKPRNCGRPRRAAGSCRASRRPGSPASIEDRSAQPAHSQAQRSAAPAKAPGSLASSPDPGRPLGSRASDDPRSVGGSGGGASWRFRRSQSGQPPTPHRKS